MSVEAMAAFLGIDGTRITDDYLAITSSFRHRKRGVETKIIIGDGPAGIDETLFRNIARAHRYFELIRAGQTFSDIATSENVSKRRVQQVVDLAFLAPDLIRDIRDGKQAVGLTSEWLMRHTLPPLWQEQRKLISSL